MQMATLFGLLLSLAWGVRGQAYVPGTPGGQWTEEQASAVKDKLIHMFGRARWSLAYPKKAA